jgi:hypothetical protein
MSIVRLLDKYDISFDNSCKIFVDAANPSFISTLERAVNEGPNYCRLHTTNITILKYTICSSYNRTCLSIPVPFSKEHKNMLAHAKELLEYQNGMVAIHPRFNKLITALRPAVENGESILDKDATSHDDLFDVFRLSLQFWH